MLKLAERAGLHRLVGEHVTLDIPGGVNAHLKVPALVAGMVAGADSIDDMALLRRGGTAGPPRCCPLDRMLLSGDMPGLLLA